MSGEVQNIALRYRNVKDILYGYGAHIFILLEKVK